MHEAPGSLGDYRKQIDDALNDDFLRRTLDTFAVAYKANRKAVFEEIDEHGLIRQIADAKDDACKHMEELYEQFKGEAEKRGVIVHRAKDAEEANNIIVQIAKENKAKFIIKSKSMTAEEIQLNHALEDAGMVVDETELGEWILKRKQARLRTGKIFRSLSKQLVYSYGASLLLRIWEFRGATLPLPKMQP